MTIRSPAEKLSNGVLREISAIEDDVYIVYEVSRTQLEVKLRSLTELQQFALVEYIEEYWSKTHDYTNIGKPEKEYVPDPENEGKSGEELNAEVVKAISENNTK